MEIATVSQAPRLPDLSLLNIYQSCDELPLKVFIRCMVSGDYTGLVKSGPTDTPEAWAAIEDAWLSIYSQYCALIGGIQIAAFIQRAKTVNALSSKINRITALVDCARLIVCDELITALAAEGYKVNAARLASADDEGYLQELDAVMARLRPEKMKLDSLIKELPKADDKQKSTEQDFTRTLLEVSKYEGYQVKAKDTTVSEYCEYVKRLRDYIESQIKLNGHGRKGK
jgi:hypothetical protein